jgi:hypothetical protein
MEQELHFNPPGMVEIRLAGHLDPSWSDWFEGMNIEHEPGGVTLLSGRLQDGPALYGLILKIRDLGLELVSINRVGGAGDE